MKYVKAQYLFPEPLLEEIQKYVQGEMVYIPKTADNYKKWGAITGAKMITNQRNESIIQGYKGGLSISELSEQYYLSEETIKKIIYRQK